MITPKKQPTTFFSLPHELRQDILAQNYEMQWLTPDSVENLEMVDEASTTWNRDMEGIHEAFKRDIEEVEKIWRRRVCKLWLENRKNGGKDWCI